MEISALMATSAQSKLHPSDPYYGPARTRCRVFSKLISALGAAASNSQIEKGIRPSSFYRQPLETHRRSSKARARFGAGCYPHPLGQPLAAPRSQTICQLLLWELEKTLLLFWRFRRRIESSQHAFLQSPAQLRTDDRSQNIYGQPTPPVGSW